MIDEQTRAGLTRSASVTVFADGRTRETIDELAVEEPLEIRVSAGGETRALALTMRTPGNDFELAAGFLYAEGVIGGRTEIRDISYCLDPTVDPQQRYNIVTIALAAAELPPLERLERHFTVNSACGVCGKASLKALQMRAEPIEDNVRLTRGTIASLPHVMRTAQRIFATTGGLHAAALFNAGGEPIAVREDVGRHNALDKLVGWALLNQRLPLTGCVLLVSGRASYELLQKSIVARIPVVCAVSAPSSLAVELSRAFNVTLCGFVRGDTCNVYASPERITP